MGRREYIALRINGVGGGCFLLLPMFQLINENTQWSVCQTSIWASSESKVLWTVRTIFNQAHPSFIQQWSKLDDTETTGFWNHQDTIHFGMLHVTSKRKRLSWVGLQDFVLCKAEGNVGKGKITWVASQIVLKAMKWSFTFSTPYFCIIVFSTSFPINHTALQSKLVLAKTICTV